MSGLFKNEPSLSGVTFVQVKDGKLRAKNKSTNEYETFDGISGVIKKFDISTETYEGKTITKALFTIYVNDEKFILDMYLDSAYFKNLCNSLKSGLPHAEVTLMPSRTKNERGGYNHSFFVKQDGKFLKHFHTKEKMGDCPPIEQTKVNGVVKWDGTKQVEYYKTWALTTYFTIDEEEHGEAIENETDNSISKNDLPF